MSQQTPMDAGMTPQQRRELLVRLLREKAQRAQLRTSPTSCAQERLWVMEQLGQDGTCYNIVFHMTIRGQLRAEVLEQSLGDLVARHETLRTTFQSQGNSVVQAIAATAGAALERIDCTEGGTLSEDEQNDRVRQHIRTQETTPFDLTAGPLLRASLLRLRDDEHVLVFAIHHIIADGWSVGIMARELGDAYSARINGQAPVFAPLPIQYADYAAWQRRWLDESDDARRQLDYWSGRLKDVPPLQLTTDSPRPAQQRYRGNQRSITLSREATDLLRQFCASRGQTLFMACMGAFTALLSRISGQNDIAIGSPIANRNRAELEGLVGFLVNMVVLRTDVSDDPTFEVLVQRMSKIALEAYANQDYPFDKLVEHLQPQRDPSRNPLFQVALTVHNEPINSPRLAGLQAGEVLLPGFTVGGEYDVATQHTRFDLELHLWDRPEGLIGTIVFNTDLFTSATIDHLAQSFSAMLSGGASNPSLRISQLPIVSVSQQQLLDHWCNRPVDYPRDVSVHSICEAVAAANPTREAIACGEVSWTYAKLDARANSIARQLIEAGVRRGDRVPLLLRRSPQTIAAILGTLKAGGVYVPLDPGYPLQRLQIMLEITGKSILLCDRSSEPIARQLDVARVLMLEDVQAHRDAASPRFVSNQIDGGEPAYVMFTSGSTGVPKGVVIPHRGINRLVLNNDFARLDADQTLLQMAPLAFDASTFEIWGALLNGGRCVLYEHDLPTPREIGAAIRRHGVTTMFITTALFSTIIDEDADALSPMKQVIFGGEVCSVPHVRKALAALPGVQLIHAYGPTEVTTFSTCYPIPSVSEEHHGSIPIGRPIRNTSAKVVDARGAAVPPGVPAELYLGGDGVAIEYLNSPQLTSERFVSLDGECGQRWYRTGDIVRWTADGLLDFVGRADQQVKVHGFRIELGEIESALVRCDGVKHASVIALGEGAAKRLVAYLVPDRAGAAFSWESITAELQNRLPQYMIPVLHVQLDRLPLNTNGKVDKAALPVPEVRRAQAPRAAGSDLERTVGDIWANVLELDSVGMDDNFFDLGGQSLLLVKVHERLSWQLEVNIPVVDLFRFTTVRTLAAHLARSAKTQYSGLPLNREPQSVELAGTVARQRGAQ